MKKLPIPRPDDYGELKKMLLRMKLSFALMLLTFLQVSASVHSQDRLTMNVKQIGWQSFFDLLEKKSNYTFLYKDNVLPHDEKIDVEANDLTVPQILDIAMRRSPLAYQLLPNRLIVITPRTGIPAAAPDDERITGKVLSPTGDPLAGASVRIKGSSLGTSTDSTGNFTLNVPDGATL